MSLPRALPRVTYSNVHDDFTGVHVVLDEVIADFSSRKPGKTANVIAGKDDWDGKPYDVVSPIDSTLNLGTYIEASPAAVKRAVAAAREAQKSWSRLDWSVRVSILRRVGDLLSARKYELAVANVIEVGKTRLEGMGEVEEAVDMFRHFCDDFENNQGFKKSLARAVPRERTLSILRPYGVFGVIAPFNFPVALSIKMIIPSILSGNAVVYKPSPNAGLTGRMIMDLLTDGGVPAGVVNMLCGEEAGRLIVDAEGIDGVAFTGSHAVGMSIFRKFGNGPYARPVLAEMGGKNPVYVTASADLDVAAEGVARSAFGLQGQKCSAAEVAYIDTKIYDAFVAKLLEVTSNMKLGDPRSLENFIGPLVSKDSYETYVAAVAEARRDGQILHGGRRHEEKALARGYYVEPLIVGDLPPTSRLVKEELFLPFIALCRYTSLDEALTAGNSVSYGLTAGAYAKGKDLDLFLDRAEAGVLYANRRSGATTGAWPGFQTFPGWKGSGLSGKGGFGPYDLPQFMREQSHTIMEDA